MTFLPIVDRELSVTARRAGTYWLRFWAAAAVLAIWLFLLTTARVPSPADMGQLLFNALGILALAFSMFAGAVLTADCLSEEKREGTLGLLFLTDLKSYDVVLGKLAASSLLAFFGLLATFPILGLTLLLGGVTGREFARLVLVFGVTLFFSLGIGMFVSAVSRDSRQALLRAFLLVVIFAGVCPALWLWESLAASRWGGGAFRAAPNYLLLPSPGYAYRQGLDIYYRFGTGAHDFWLSLGIIFSIGLAGIVLACIALPHTWRRQGADAPVKVRSKKRAASFGGKIGAQRTKWLNRNPAFWLAARDAAPRRAAARVMLVLVPLWFVLWSRIFVGRSGSPTEIPLVICIYSSYFLHLIVKLLIAVEAGRRFNQDRRSGALELLLSTPLRVHAILTGQKQALWRHFRGPMFVLCVVNLSLLVAIVSVTNANQMNGNALAMFTEVAIGGILMLFADFHALSWVGMWQGLDSAKHPRAVVGTLASIMVPPWAAVFFMIFLRIGFTGPNSQGTVVAMWFLFGAVVDVMLGVAARQKLYSRFRRLAVQGVEAKTTAR